MLRGYSVPRSPEGRSSLVPAPPWHYVGDFLVIEYWAEPAAVEAVLPPGLEPHPDPGRCAALFIDWQSCSDSREELDDPVRSQYREFFVVVNALLDGEPVTTCPYIWVDRDFAMARGWMQGFPKKLGSIHMTRHFSLSSKAGPDLAAGARFTGTLAAADRRLAFGTVTLERESVEGPTHNDPPLMNVRHFPRLAAGRHDEPAVHELVRARSRDRSISRSWEGAARFRFTPAPTERGEGSGGSGPGRGFALSLPTRLTVLRPLRTNRARRVAAAPE